MTSVSASISDRAVNASKCAGRCRGKDCIGFGVKGSCGILSVNQVLCCVERDGIGVYGRCVIEVMFFSNKKRNRCERWR